MCVCVCVCVCVCARAKGRGAGVEMGEVGSRGGGCVGWVHLREQGDGEGVG